MDDVMTLLVAQSHGALPQPRPRVGVEASSASVEASRNELSCGTMPQREDRISRFSGREDRGRNG